MLDRHGLLVWAVPLRLSICCKETFNTKNYNEIIFSSKLFLCNYGFWQVTDKEYFNRSFLHICVIWVSLVISLWCFSQCFKFENFKFEWRVFIKFYFCTLPENRLHWKIVQKNCLNMAKNALLIFNVNSSLPRVPGNLPLIVRNNLEKIQS